MATNRPWSKEETEALRLYYPEHGPSWDGWEELLPGRTQGSIRTRAGLLGLTASRSSTWTKEEEELLREHYPYQGPSWEKWGHLLPGRTRGQITKAANALGLKASSVVRASWTAEEDGILRRYWSSTKMNRARWGELIPNHSMGGIRARATSMGIVDKRNPDWSEEEIRILKENYSSVLCDAAAWEKLLPTRSLASIQLRAHKLGLTGLASKKWTTEEDSIVLEHYHEYGSDAEAWGNVLPGRTVQAVQTRAGKLGAKRPVEKWTEDELEIIRKYYVQLSGNPEAWEALLPGRPAASIRSKASQLGLSGPASVPWTSEEDRILAANYPHVSPSDKKWEQLLPGRTPDSITSHASRLGLKYEGGPLKRRGWSKEEEDALLENYPVHGPAWKGWERLCPGRSRDQIERRARRLRLADTDGAPSAERPWHATEDLLLIMNADKGLSWPGWRKVLPGRAAWQVEKRAASLGIFLGETSAPEAQGGSETCEKTFGAMLVEVREIDLSSLMGVDVLAACTGSTLGTVKCLLDGRGRPTQKMLERVCRLLNKRLQKDAESWLNGLRNRVTSFGETTQELAERLRIPSDDAASLLEDPYQAPFKTLLKICRALDANGSETDSRNS